MIEFVEIGRLSKPYGIQGQIKSVVEEEYLNSLKRAEFVFINQDGSFVPYFIEELTENPHFLLKLEELDRPEDVVLLSTRPIFLPSNEVIHDDGDHMSLKIKYKGFGIADESGRSIGIIEKVEEFPQQLMATVLTPTKESVLIPLVESFIIEVDEESKLITMNIPEGLLSL